MPPKDFTPLEIDYLAKDYASFRQLMLDHLNLRVSEWKEPSAADLGNAIVEVLAYTADYMSYYQDAMATEAYLGTARRRRSIKRHARLLDYRVHEGCNARVWVQVQVDQDLQVPKRTQLLAGVTGFDHLIRIPANSADYYDVLTQNVKVFETMQDAWLYKEHNQFNFYVEEGVATTLTQGSTSAVLLGELPHLQPGAVLVLAEVLNPNTGQPDGADPALRHAVLLTGISRGRANGKALVTVQWGEDDALPFDLPLAAFIQGEFTPDMSVAASNILMADHGQTIEHEALPAVLAGLRYRPGLEYVGLTFSAGLEDNPLKWESASAVMLQDVRQALPEVSLFQLERSAPFEFQLASEANPPKIDSPDKKSLASLHSLLQPAQRPNLIQALHASGMRIAPDSHVRALAGGRLEIRDPIRKQHLVASHVKGQNIIQSYQKWTVRPDLLSSGPLATDYIVDVEEDGRAYLRFGFGGHGRLPQAGDVFTVSYRIGTGTDGNIREDTITHIVSTDSHISKVSNPLPAQGGTDREPVEDARLYAPFAFQTQERCVTPADYCAIALRFPEVLHAAAQVRWTGSWYTAFVYIQRAAARSLEPSFKVRLTQFLDVFCLAGFELELRPPYFIPLEIELEVTLKHGFDSNQVEGGLQQVFSSGLLPDGTPGFFYPDNFNFNQPLYLSQVLTAAMAVPGVSQVEARRFSRLDDPHKARKPSLSAVIAIHELEILRLDNDPSDPERGSIRFKMKGGL